MHGGADADGGQWLMADGSGGRLLAAGRWLEAVHTYILVHPPYSPSIQDMGCWLTADG